MTKKPKENLCGKPMPNAKNGKSRGVCTRPKGHCGPHGNKTCTQCGGLLKSKSGLHTSWCRKCQAADLRKRYGLKPQNVQIPGHWHIFRNCKCAGLLPRRKGKSNKLAKWKPEGWGCRATSIIFASQKNSRAHGYVSIDPKTPHSVIRKMMNEPNCVLCGEPLKWEFGNGKTPHLHHNHETGEIYGFTHPHCNPHALEDEIERLRNEIVLLKTLRAA